MLQNILAQRSNRTQQNTDGIKPAQPTQQGSRMKGQRRRMSPPRRVTNSTVNRIREQQRIERENLVGCQQVMIHFVFLYGNRFPRCWTQQDWISCANDSSWFWFVFWCSILCIVALLDAVNPHVLHITFLRITQTVSEVAGTWNWVASNLPFLFDPSSIAETQL